MPSTSSQLPTPALEDASLRQSYRIGRGEQGVLTFEPYKSLLLQFWKFRTRADAQQSAETLWSHFQSYVERGDFVGADMARKFIQMGMTRAKRYANHKGGRKYAYKADGTRGEEKAKEDHPDRKEKEEASMVFRGYWNKCKEDEKYKALQQQFTEELKTVGGSTSRTSRTKKED